MSATRTRPLILALLLLTLSWIALPSFAQTTVGTGRIVGTVSDPSVAMISGTKITITNVATRQVINVVISVVPGHSAHEIRPRGGLQMRIEAEWERLAAGEANPMGRIELIRVPGVHRMEATCRALGIRKPHEHVSALSQ